MLRRVNAEETMTALCFAFLENNMMMSLETRTGRVLALVTLSVLLFVPVPRAAAGQPAVTYTLAFDAQSVSIGKHLSFDTVTLTGADALQESGQPVVPAVDVRLALPAGMRATGARAVAAVQQTLPGQFVLVPGQRPRRVSDPGPTELPAPDPRTYAQAEPYPGQLVELAGQADLAGQAFVTLRLYPVQYVPAARTLTLCTSLTILVEGEAGYTCGDYLPAGISEFGRGAYAELVAALVVNPADVQLRSDPAASAGPRGVPAGDFDYVIITKTDWVDDFQPLADWKTKKGVPAAIVTTDWIYNSGGYSGSNVDKLKAFVIDAQTNWGATYFLLGGDTDTVPYHSRTFSSVDPTSIPNDTYYADYDGDWVCEVHVGRASVNSTTAISNFINRVFLYEKNPPLTNYAQTAFFCGFDLSSYGSGEGEDMKIAIKNTYLPASWTYQYEYDSESGNHKTATIGYLNSGNNLANHADHSDTGLMGVGATNHGWNLYNSDMTALTNAARPTILYSLGCWACDYASTTCIAEAFVRNANGGGVAFVGNSRYGWYYIGSSDGLSARYDRYFFRSLFTQGQTTLGNCFSNHKNTAYQNNDYYKYIYTELTLLGDPELPIWTADPQTLAVNYPETLYQGQVNTVLVQVSAGGGPVSAARVCLLKAGDIYQVGQTDANGNASFEVSPASEGTLSVTVCKHDYLPFEGTATVVPPAQYTLSLTITGPGDVTLDPPGGSYAGGTTVTLTALPHDGARFDHWEGALNGSANPATLLVDQNLGVTAVFMLRGDMNCDGAVGFGDINPFVLAISSPGSYAVQYPNCTLLNGDTNGDGAFDFADINSFVALLSGS